MKTSKILGICALMVLLVAIGVSAAGFYLPLPISGKVYGDNANGQDIQVKNLRSGEVMKTQTSSSGEFLVDFANVGGADPKYAYGDTFEATILSCAGDASCVKTIKYTTQSNILFEFIGIPVTACPICQACVTDQEKNDATANIIWGIVTALFAVAGLVLGGYSWFPGLQGLAKYNVQEGLKLLRSGDYAGASKKFNTAANIIKTATEKAKGGVY